MIKRKQGIFLIPDEVYPWEQLPEETDRAFAAFKVFMELRTDVRPTEPEYRNLRNVARKLGFKTPSKVYDWSSKYHWRDRIAAVDDWELKLLKNEEIKEKIAMKKRHVNLSRKVQDVGLARLEEILDDVKNGIIPEIDYSTLYKMIESAVKLERLSVGETTENLLNADAPPTRIEIIYPEHRRDAGTEEEEDDGEDETE